MYRNVCPQQMEDLFINELNMISIDQKFYLQCEYVCLFKDMVSIKGSPTVAKSRTLYLKSHLKSLKSLKFQNLKSRKVETIANQYISASNHVKIGRTISNKLLVKVTNHEKLARFLRCLINTYYRRLRFLIRMLFIYINIYILVM